MMYVDKIDIVSYCAIALVVTVILNQALINILLTTSTSVILRACAGVITITVLW